MMVNEQNTAIITYVDRNNEENLERDFLCSLFIVAKYVGRVVVLDYGISADVKQRIMKKYPVELVDCKVETDIFVDRYKDIVSVVKNLEENISVVITMDSGDIWFQSSLSPFFDVNPGEIGTVQEMRIWDKDEWALKCLNNLSDSDKKRMLDTLSGTYVRNSGVIIGDRDAMLQLARNVYNDILVCGYSFFGIDQIFVNYEITKLNEEKRRSLSELLNYVLVSNVNDFKIIDGTVYRKNGERIVVVHNAGGNWRVLERPFENKWSNPDQYTIENVRRIKGVKEV